MVSSHHRQAVSCGAVLVILFLACAPVHLVWGADRALLIGVNDYQDPRIRDLRGCEDDVEATRRLLTDDYGFASGQIRVLIRGDASRAGILDAIDAWLVAGTQPGDRVLLYYSGHGSQKQCGADKPEEADGYDEILCAVDYNPETQANCVVDDELNERLRLLDGRNVLIIVDACHSGSITKNINGRLRSIETVDTAQSVPKYIPPPRGSTYRDVFFRPPTNFAADSASHVGGGQLRSDGRGAIDGMRGTEQIIDEVRANYVVLTSCSDAQTAEEIRVRIGDHYVRRGAFTWFLAAGLSGPADADGDSEVSYREIVTYVNERLRDPRYDLTQTPELRTRREFWSQPFFGRVLTNRGLPKVVEISGDRVTINRGAQHGVRSNQAYEPANVDAVTDGSAIHIESVEQFLATARIQGPITLARGDPIRPRDVFYNPGGLTVWLAPAASQSSDFGKRLRQRLADMDDVTLTDDPASADRTVWVRRWGNRWLAAIYSRYGTLRSKRDYADEHAVVEGIAERICGELFILQLARLEGRDRDFDLRLWVQGDRRAFVAYRNPDQREQIEFGLQASHDCCVTLISVDSQGSVFTDLLSPDFRVHGGRDYTLPVPGDPPLEVRPPPGRDVVYALATPNPIRIKVPSLCEGGASRAIQTITRELRAIDRRRRESDLDMTLTHDAMQLAGEGWAVTKITVDTFPEEQAGATAGERIRTPARK